MRPPFLWAYAGNTGCAVVSCRLFMLTFESALRRLFAQPFAQAFHAAFCVGFLRRLSTPALEEIRKGFYRKSLLFLVGYDIILEN